MARRKANFDGFEPDFLTKAQAMAYTHRLTEETFNEEILPHVHVYRGGKGGIYAKIELKNRILEMVEIRPTKA